MQAEAALMRLDTEGHRGGAFPETEGEGSHSRKAEVPAPSCIFPSGRLRDKPLGRTVWFCLLVFVAETRQSSRLSFTWLRLIILGTKVFMLDKPADRSVAAQLRIPVSTEKIKLDYLMSLNASTSSPLQQLLSEKHMSLLEPGVLEGGI